MLTEPTDYQAVQDELEKKDVGFELRRMLAGKAFNLTSAYDAAVSRFMFAAGKEDDAPDFPSYYTVPLLKKQELRYGENVHQKVHFRAGGY